MVSAPVIGVEQGADLAVDDDRVQALLAAEVLVDDGLGDLGRGGDLLDAGAVEALLGEQLAADVEQLLAPLLAGHPDPVAPGRPAGVGVGAAAERLGRCRSAVVVIGVIMPRARSPACAGSRGPGRSRRGDARSGSPSREPVGPRPADVGRPAELLERPR